MCSVINNDIMWKNPLWRCLLWLWLSADGPIRS